MVLKGTGVRGDEQIGTEELFGQSVRAAAEVGTQAVRLGVNAVKEVLEKRKQQQQIPPEIKGNFRQDLYQAYLDKGVPEEVASEAADAVMLSQDASNSPAIKKANRIVLESENSQADVGDDELEGSKPDEEEATLEGKQEQSSPSQKAPVQASSPSTSAPDNKEPKLRTEASKPNQADASTQADSTQPAAQSLKVESAEPATQPKAEQPAVVGQGSVEQTPLEGNKQTSSQVEDASASKKVTFSQKPSEMSWNDLRGAARDITAETGKNPTGRKKAQVLEFVEDYQAEQQKQASAKQDTHTSAAKQHYSSAVATPPVTRVPIVQPQKPSLETSYNAGLKAAEVDSKVAKSAASDLVSGKGADSSAAISAANQQVKQKAQKVVVQRSALHQMYYDVLAKQGIKPELAEKASKDLAEGKGALSSKAVKQAHKTILDDELKKTGSKTPHERGWQKHKRYVTETDPRKRDVAVAKSASAAGLSQRKVEDMVRLNSPNVAKIQRQEGSTQAVHYIKGVASEAAFMAKRQATAKGKIATRPKSKKAGVEV